MNADHRWYQSAVNPHQGKKDTLIVLAAQISALAVGIASQSLLAWCLGAAGRGSFAVCLVIGTLMPTVFGLALDRAIQVKLAGGHLSIRAALAASWIVTLIAGVAGAVTTLTLLAAIPALRAKADSGSFALALLMMPATLAFTFQLRLHTALRRFPDYLMANLTVSVLSLALIILLVKSLDLGTRGALLASLAGYVVADAYGFARLWHAAGAQTGSASVAVHWASLRSFGVRSYPATVGHAIDLNLGTMVLSLLASRSEIGLFAAVSALAQRLLIVPQSLQETLLPRVAADAEGRPQLVAAAARIAFTVTLVAAALLLLLRRPIVTVLLSHDFLAALPMFFWMLSGIAIHACSTVLMPYFDGTGRPQIVSASVWAGLLANLAATMLLFPLVGANAAAMGFFFSFLARFITLFIVFHRSTGIPLRSVLFPVIEDLAAMRLALTSSLAFLKTRSGKV